MSHFVSLDGYLANSYRPDCDYLDGLLVARTGGERDHSRAQARITMLLGAAETRLRVTVLTEQRVQVHPRRFRVPDICLAAQEAPDEQVLRTPPLVCIEILSKDDTMEAMQERIDDYLSMGVPAVWVIHPRTRRGFEYTASGMVEAKDGVLRALDGALALSLREVFQ